MARIALSSSLALLFLLPLGGCKKTGDGAQAPDDSNAHADWDYEEHGPDEWAGKCATGEMQSPIDLPASLLEGSDHLEINYSPDPLRIVDNGHTIQVNHQGASQLSIEGVPFKLIQYHFHSPSEHAEQGDRHTLELHLVHTDEVGNFAVIGVFLEAEGMDPEDPAHERLWQHLPKDHADHDEHVYVGEPVDPSTFLPSGRAHYRYHGSLTTPPCTETVTWLVMDEPLKVSAEHIAAFQELYQANARPLQMRPQWCLDLVPMSSPLSESTEPPN